MVVTVRSLWNLAVRPRTFSRPALSRLPARFSSSALGEESSPISITPLVHWLDLRGSGLSMLERLSLEEALLRHDDRSWAIVGTHDPWPPRYFSPSIAKNLLPSYLKMNEGPSSFSEGLIQPNQDCLIVMGIGGKADRLLNIPLVQQDRVLVCKRFSGGGTVVLDASSLWTTFIGRTAHFPGVRPYPEDIMTWSADAVFGPTFEHLTNVTINKRKDRDPKSSGRRTLVLDTKSCSASENLGKTLRIPDSEGTQRRDIPTFALRENDYVFGDLKMGGNAQSIVKGGWLHHTSFLWDFEEENMRYLQIPAKRPEYRGDRSHDEFLVKLEPYFGNKKNFYASLLYACQQSFAIEKVTLNDALRVVGYQLGGMDSWWEANRTRIVDDF